MTTRRQIAANKRNAQKSTGPKTKEGKATSSINALKHGMLARSSETTCDRPGSYAEIVCRLYAEHLPETYSQELLVERIAENELRSRRGRHYETARYQLAHMDFCLQRFPELQEKDPTEIVEFMLSVPYYPPLDEMNRMTRYQTSLNRDLEKLFLSLRREQKRRVEQFDERVIE